MNKETAKAKAKALINFLESQGVSLKHSAALEAVAKIEGLPSYNVLLSQPPAASMSLPSFPVVAHDQHGGHTLGNLHVWLDVVDDEPDAVELVFTHYVDGEPTDDYVACSCTHLKQQSSPEQKRIFIQQCAELVSGYLKDSISIYELDFAVQALALGESFDTVGKSLAKKFDLLTPETPDLVDKEWEVDICRTGYGFTSITIKGAKSQKEAEEMALDEAGNHYYSEKDSDYSVVGSSPFPVR